MSENSFDAFWAAISITEKRVAELKLENEKLVETLRQARACLLNLQPDEVNPVQQQMQKMIAEISAVID